MTSDFFSVQALDVQGRDDVNLDRASLKHRVMLQAANISQGALPSASVASGQFTHSWLHSETLVEPGDHFAQPQACLIPKRNHRKRSKQAAGETPATEFSTPGQSLPNPVLLCLNALAVHAAYASALSYAIHSTHESLTWGFSIH